MLYHDDDDGDEDEDDADAAEDDDHDGRIMMKMRRRKMMRKVESLGRAATIRIDRFGQIVDESADRWSRLDLDQTIR